MLPRLDQTGQKEQQVAGYDGSTARLFKSESERITVDGVQDGCDS